MSLLDKIPPNKPEIEKTIISICLNSPDGCRETSDALTTEDFYLPSCRRIFEIIGEEIAAGHTVDLVSIAELMRVRYGDDAQNEVAEVAEFVGSRANLQRYCGLLQEATQRRRLINIGLAALSGAHVEDVPLNETIEGLDSKFTEIYTASQSTERPDLINPITMANRMEHAKIHGFRTPALSTGWRTVDDCYQPARGMLNIVTGIPAHGKSSFMDALALNLSKLHGIRWAYYSPENWPTEIHMQKLMELYTGKYFMFPIEQYSSTPEQDTLAIHWLSQYFRLIHLSEEQRTLDALMRLIDKPVKEGAFDGLIVDPWNALIAPEPKGYDKRETKQIGNALNRLRFYARRYNLLVFILAHPAKMQKPHGAVNYDVPTLYNVDGSAHWFNMADNGLCVYRPDMEVDEIALYVQKVKYKNNGHIGTVPLSYIKESGRFEVV